MDLARNGGTKNRASSHSTAKGSRKRRKLTDTSIEETSLAEADAAALHDSDLQDDDDDSGSSGSENHSEFEDGESSFESNDSDGDDENIELTKDTTEAATQDSQSQPSRRIQIQDVINDSSKDSNDASSSKIFNNRPDPLNWDVPHDSASPITVHFREKSLQKNFPKATSDLPSITVHNSFSQVFVECIPLLFCSPKGFSWVSSRLNDPELHTRLLTQFSHLHDSIKDSMSDLVQNSRTPIEFDKDIVYTGIEGYFKSFGGSFIFSFDEVNRLVFQEFGENLPFDGKKYELPESELKDPLGRTEEELENIKRFSQNGNNYQLAEGGTVTGMNGYAEKLSIATLTACGIALTCQDKSLGSLPYVDYKTATSYINTAQYYLERLTMIGNSSTGVKGATVLLYLYACVINFKPATTVSSIVARLAQEIGLHRKESFVTLSLKEACLRVNTWWLLYCLEKDVCIKSGRPSFLNDVDISTPLPNMYPISESYMQLDGEKFNVISSLVKLYRIWYKINQDLLSPFSNSLTVKERLVKIVYYDKELQNWKNSVPEPFQPDSPNPSHIVGLKVKISLPHLTFRHFIFYCQATYFFVLGTLLRQISSHPSWIYRFIAADDSSQGYDSNTDSPNVTAKTEAPENGPAPADDRDTTSPTTTTGNSASPSEKSAKSKSFIGGTFPLGKKGFVYCSNVSDDTDADASQCRDLKDFDPETVASLLREARESHTKGKLRRSISLNGVKILTRKIALDHPRLLRSTTISYHAARKTIEIFLFSQPWNFLPIRQLSFFGLNAFINLFVNCIFSPLDPDTLINLSYMRNLIEVFDRLYSSAQNYLQHVKVHTMLSVYADGLTKFIEQKRRDANMKNHMIPEFITAVKISHDENDKERVTYVINNANGSVASDKPGEKPKETVSSTVTGSSPSPVSPFSQSLMQDPNNVNQQSRHSSLSRPSPLSGRTPLFGDVAISPDPFVQFTESLKVKQQFLQTQRVNSGSNSSSIISPVNPNLGASYDGNSNSPSSLPITANEFDNFFDATDIGTVNRVYNDGSTESAANANEHNNTSNTSANNFGFDTMNPFLNLNTSSGNTPNLAREPMLDILYPDGHVASDVDLFNSLFYTPGPWMGADSVYNPAQFNGPPAPPPPYSNGARDSQINSLKSSPYHIAALNRQHQNKQQDSYVSRQS